MGGWPQNRWEVGLKIGGRYDWCEIGLVGGRMLDWWGVGGWIGGRWTLKIG